MGFPHSGIRVPFRKRFDIFAPNLFPSSCAAPIRDNPDTHRQPRNFPDSLSSSAGNEKKESFALLAGSNVF